MGWGQNLERLEHAVLLGARVTQGQKAEWRKAMRWRGRVEAALGGSALTFTQWLVLDALRELIAETGDAVNQNEVAARVALSRATVSFVMSALDKKGLVDRGPDLTGRAWRIFLTARAERLLCDVTADIETASDP